MSFFSPFAVFHLFSSSHEKTHSYRTVILIRENQVKMAHEKQVLLHLENVTQHYVPVVGRLHFELWGCKVKILSQSRFSDFTYFGIFNINPSSNK